MIYNEYKEENALRMNRILSLPQSVYIYMEIGIPSVKDVHVAAGHLCAKRVQT